MNPIALIFAAAYGYLAGNPRARQATFRQINKLAGMAVDGLNRQGGKNAQPPVSTEQEPEQQGD